MISIARKNLFSEKTRFLISVSGVVFSTFLVMTLVAMYFAVRAVMGLYVDKAGADIWVMGQGTTNIFYGTSNLSETLASTIERKIGKGSVNRIIIAAASVDVNTDPTMTKRRREKQAKKEDSGGFRGTVIVVGFPQSGAGGPWKMKEGKNTVGKNEAIIDSALAEMKHLSIGDEIVIQNTVLKIVGISEESNLMVLQMVFIPFEDAQEIFNFKGKTNYFLISLDNSEDRIAVRDRINKEIPNVIAKTRAEFARSHVKLFDESDAMFFIPVMVIGFIVGTVVVGLTIYTATTERLKEFGILKAIGASNRALYKIVLEQSLWTVTIGFVGGFLATSVALPLIQRFTGLFIPLTLFVVGLTFCVSLVMGLLSSILPIRRISQVDPIIVFK